jgi:hypothetical protein
VAFQRADNGCGAAAIGCAGGQNEPPWVRPGFDPRCPRRPRE